MDAEIKAVGRHIQGGSDEGYHSLVHGRSDCHHHCALLLRHLL